MRTINGEEKARRRLADSQTSRLADSQTCRLEMQLIDCTHLAGEINKEDCRYRLGNQSSF